MRGKLTVEFDRVTREWWIVARRWCEGRWWRDAARGPYGSEDAASLALVDLVTAATEDSPCAG